MSKLVTASVARFLVASFLLGHWQGGGGGGGRGEAGDELHNESTK